MVDAATSSERVTVLLVSLGAAYGGAETYYVKLARILQPEYTLVAVVCCERLAEEFRGLGIAVEWAGATPDMDSSRDSSLDSNGARRYLTALQACWRIYRRYPRRHRPRVAHLNGQPESYLAAFLRLLGLRLLITRHTPFTDLFLQEGAAVPVFLKRWLAVVSLRSAHRTICVSRLLLGQLSEWLPAPRLSCIPTWVDDALLVWHERPVPSRPLHALFVGRVTQNKGIFDLIEAVRRSGKVSLTVVGEGDHLHTAQQLAEGLPIVFAGFARDCGPAYRAADLLVFPSHEGFEGLPQVLLEALACGLPCLAADIAAVREIAETDVDAAPLFALFRASDVDDLARQLSALADNADRLGPLGLAGRRAVEQHFTLAVVAPLYLRAFAEAQQ